MSKAQTAASLHGEEPVPEKHGMATDTTDGVVEATTSPAHVDMEGYRQQTPLWRRVWQHSLTQLMLLSVQAFCGPAMDDAIAGKTTPVPKSCCSCLEVIIDRMLTEHAGS